MSEVDELVKLDNEINVIEGELGKEEDKNKQEKLQFRIKVLKTKCTELTEIIIRKKEEEKVGLSSSSSSDDEDVELVGYKKCYNCGVRMKKKQNKCKKCGRVMLDGDNNVFDKTIDNIALILDECVGDKNPEKVFKRKKIKVRRKKKIKVEEEFDREEFDQDQRMNTWFFVCVLTIVALICILPLFTSFVVGIFLLLRIYMGDAVYYGDNYYWL